MSSPMTIDKAMPKKDRLQYSPVDDGLEDEGLLQFEHRRKLQLAVAKRWPFLYSKTHILGLYALNLMLIALVAWAFARPLPDPSLGVYCRCLFQSSSNLMAVI